MAETCPDCNVELIRAEYSGDPNLMCCPKCEEEFM